MRPRQVIVLCSLAKLSGQPTEMLEGGGGIVMVGISSRWSINTFTVVASCYIKHANVQYLLGALTLCICIC